MPATAEAQEQPATRFAKDQLKAVVERVERLEEEKKALSDDKDVCGPKRMVEGAGHVCGCASRTPTSAKEQEAILKPICWR